MSLNNGSPTSLTLYDIESELAQLISLREEMAELGEDTAACEEQIAEYCRREVGKVDGIRAFLRQCDAMVTAAIEEAAAMRSRATWWEERGKRLRATVLRVMQEAGKKKLLGATGSLSVRKNPPHVEVTPALLPDDLQRCTITMSLAQWLRMGSAEDLDISVTTEPNKRAIAEALKQPCERCGGKSMKECEACGGRGTRGVPGARLVASDRLEVR